MYGGIVGFNMLGNARRACKSVDHQASSCVAAAALNSLMQANSRRGALAAALLPPLHWVMLGALCTLMMSAFLLFDSDFSSPVAENRTIFAVLSAMLVTILQARTTHPLASAGNGYSSIVSFHLN